MTSLLRQNDAITAKWRRFDAITTLLLRHACVRWEVGAWMKLEYEESYISNIHFTHRLTMKNKLHLRFSRRVKTLLNQMKTTMED